MHDFQTDEPLFNIDTAFDLVWLAFLATLFIGTLIKAASMS